MDPRHPARRLPRRRTDRIERTAAVLLCGLGVLAVVLAGLGGVAANGAVTDRACRAAAARVRVEARVTALDGPAIGDGDGDGSRRALVSWNGPGGVAQTGRLSVPAVAAPGALVALWLDRDGRQVPPPTSPSAGALVGVVAAVAGAVLALLLLLVAWRLVCVATGRRNARGWSDGWAEVEPRWSGRATTG